MRVLRIREMRVNLLLLVQGRRKGLLLRMVFSDRAVDIRAKVKVNHPKMGGISRLLASHGKGHVSITTSLDT